MYIFSCLNRLSIFNSQQTHYYYIEYVYTYHCTCFLEEKKILVAVINLFVTSQEYQYWEILNRIDFVFVCKQGFYLEKIWFFFLIQNVLSLINKSMILWVFCYFSIIALNVAVSLVFFISFIKIDINNIRIYL